MCIQHYHLFDKFKVFEKLSLLLFLLLVSACNQIKPDKDLQETSTSTTIDSPVFLATQNTITPLSSPIAVNTKQSLFDYFDDDDFETPSNVITDADKTKTVLNIVEDNVWPSIRNNFELKTKLDEKSLQKEIKWIIKHPDYFDRINKRAKPYISYILAQALKRNLPTELVLLPIVESAFNPFAYSRGKASGLWQFIPSTGRLHNLKQNWWIDGRRDIIASTNAAFDYLENLHKLFDGDWLLALAAYNSGQGTVLKAIKHNKKLNLATDFWHLNLPKETRAYVPKLLAIKTIVANPKKYNTVLTPISLKPTFKKIAINSQLDLTLAAEMAAIDLKTLLKFNPAFNQWATDPNGPHFLLLPIDVADNFAKKYTQLPLAKHLRWAHHKIKSGDSLLAIAKKYNTSVSHLKKVNKLANSKIRAGKFLLIPISSKANKSALASYNKRLKSRQIKKQKIEKKRINHRVKKGENFWLIARKYKVDMHKLAKWNHISIKKALKPGQKLTIWKAVKTGSAKVLAETNATKVLGTKLSLQAIHYTVKRGDSLSTIANKYNVNVKDIHQWNTIAGKYIQPGQKLKLFIDITTQSRHQS